MNPEKPATGTRIPDLYDLLNLPAKQNDQQAIKVALREFAERVKKIQSPDEAKQAAKLFAIAKQNLLDKARKAAYDSLWDRAYGKKLVAASANETREIAPAKTASTANQTVSDSDQQSNGSQREPVPTWDLTELQNILPSGDAKAPLDLAAFLDSSDSLEGQRSSEDLDRDFQRLLQLLGGEIASSKPIALSATTGSEIPVAPPLNFYAPATAGVGSNSTGIGQFATMPSDPGVIAATGSALVIPPVVQKSPPSMASGSRKRRKNRDVPLLVMIGGGLTVLLTVLGVLFFMLNRKVPTKDPERVLATKDSGRSSAPQNPGTKDIPRSGLPQPGSGLPQSGSGLPQPGEGLSMEGPLVTDSNVPMNPNMEPVVTPANPTPESPDIPTPSPMPEPASPSSTPNIPTDASTPPTSEPEQTVSLTNEEKSNWKVLLSAARQSMGKNDLEKTRSSLEQASGLAKSSQQKAQLARLNTILPLVEQFREAMMAAVSELQESGSQTFQAGTQEISFVEANEERLVVKTAASKQNSRFKWDELPIVLAYGLADLKLDASPKSAAAKAAFAAVHSKINNTAKENARKLMQSAAAANAVPADTHEIFDDNYSLD